jgi:hypothetical protein
MPHWLPFISDCPRYAKLLTLFSSFPGRVDMSTLLVAPSSLRSTLPGVKLSVLLEVQSFKKATGLLKITFML